MTIGTVLHKGWFDGEESILREGWFYEQSGDNTITVDMLMAYNEGKYQNSNTMLAYVAQMYNGVQSTDGLSCSHTVNG